MRTLGRVAPELIAALRAGAGPIGFAALFSFGSNLLYLAFPLYMAQLYGRVITSRSEETLLLLTLILAVALLVMNALEDVRGRVLIGLGTSLDRKLSRRMLDGVVRSGLQAGGPSQSQALRDLDVFRQSVAGSFTNTVLDAPWAPIFLAVLFYVDWRIGAVSTAGALVLVGLAVANEMATRRALREANDAALRSYAFTDSTLRNAEVIQAMGMLPALSQRADADRRLMLASQEKASRRASTLQAAIRFTRLFLQAIVLAGGALLVIEGLVGPGVMFASTFLMARALAPVEKAVGSWQSLVNARQSFERLNRLLLAFPPIIAGTQLPPPRGQLSVERVYFTHPGATKPVLKNVTFELAAGETLGIVGPSGAGKSSLTRLLIGIVAPQSGSVRLDGADIASWPRESLGRYVGYLPQDVELFAGSVRDNIARFDPAATDDAVIEAAKLARVHDLIVRLPKGYDTDLGPNGTLLSVGQRQRIGLARALFGRPVLVVLDEPNANLDAEGEAALVNALETMKKLQSTVVVVSHRPSALKSATKILVMRDGAVERIGTRDEVLSKFLTARQAPTPLQNSQAEGRT